MLWANALQALHCGYALTFCCEHGIKALSASTQARDGLCSTPPALHYSGRNKHRSRSFRPISAGWQGSHHPPSMVTTPAWWVYILWAQFTVEMHLLPMTMPVQYRIPKSGTHTHMRIQEQRQVDLWGCFSNGVITLVWIAIELRSRFPSCQGFSKLIHLYFFRKSTQKCTSGWRQQNAPYHSTPFVLVFFLFIKVPYRENNQIRRHRKYCDRLHIHLKWGYTEACMVLITLSFTTLAGHFSIELHSKCI